MYLSRLPGYKNFLVLSALTIVLLGIILNGVIYFSQFINQTSDQFGYDVTLVMTQKQSDQRIKDQLLTCPHIKSFTIYKKLDKAAHLYLNVTSVPSQVKQDIIQYTDFTIQDFKKLPSIHTAFINFMRIFLLIIVCFLIGLLLTITKYFLSYNQESIKTMFFLGCSKSILSEKLQFQFAKYYLVGILIGLLCLFAKAMLIDFHQLSSQFLIDFLKEPSTIITFCIVPGVILTISLISSTMMIKNELDKI